MNIASRHVIAVILAATCLSFLPAPALAGTCYCSVTDVGAQETSATDAASCQTACAANQQSVGYMWAADPTQGPSSLLQCWSSADLCNQDMNGDGTQDGSFDSFQPPECPSGWHYCYPNDTIKYNLQISIPSPGGGETTSVYNYGEYVGVVYKYLVGIAVTVAIVFVMIGGIRYVVGASTGEIGKAKDMIAKAITGLVLLLFAYLILYTVNPQLIKLQVPKLPMIRQVQLLTGGETCQSLIDDGYTIDEDSVKVGHYAKVGDNYACGTVADVELDPAGAPVPDGTTCVFTWCPGGRGDTQCGTIPSADTSAATCVQNGNDFRCVTCGQVNPDSACGIVPSSTMCSAFDPADSYVAGTTDIDRYNVCGYTHSPTMVSSNLGVAGAAAASTFGASFGGGIYTAAYTAEVAADAVTGTCAFLQINCQQVTDCSSYDNFQVANSITDNELDDLNYTSFGNPNIYEICQADPCKVGKKTGKTCTVVEGTAATDCVGQ